MKWSVPFLLAIGIAGRFEFAPPWFLVLATFFYSSVALIKALGRDIPILEVTSFIYTLQLLVGPLFSYADPPAFARYQMAVSSSVYFTYTIPAVCAYLIPVAFARNHLPYLTQVMDFRAGPRVFTAGVVICAIGFVSDQLAPYVPASLRFVAFLLAELKFIGALYCYFCRHGQRRWILAAVLIATVISSLGTALFHQLILWGAITASLVIYRESQGRNLGLRIGCLIFGLVGLIALQSYKTDYREALRTNPGGGILSNLGTALSTGTMNLDSSREVLRVRLNQGWIISNVMKHIPAYEPFSGGDTLVEAVRDAFLPRALFNKAVRAGGRDNFRKFTGLRIRSNTSMGISPVGEAYGNMGIDAGILTMFVYGAIFASLYFFLTTRKKFDTLFLLWIPAVFSQALKAETELSVVLNHLVKAGIVCVILYLFLHVNLFGRVKAPLEQNPNTAQ